MRFILAADMHKGTVTPFCAHRWAGTVIWQGWAWCKECLRRRHRRSCTTGTSRRPRWPPRTPCPGSSRPRRSLPRPASSRPRSRISPVNLALLSRATADAPHIDCFHSLAVRRNTGVPVETRTRIRRSCLAYKAGMQRQAQFGPWGY